MKIKMLAPLIILCVACGSLAGCFFDDRDHHHDHDHDHDHDHVIVVPEHHEY